MSSDRGMLDALISNLEKTLMIAKAYRDMQKSNKNRNSQFMSANQSQDFSKIVSDQITQLLDQQTYWGAGSERR